MRRVASLLLSIAVLSPAACVRFPGATPSTPAKSPPAAVAEPTIIGKWLTPAGAGFSEFKPDGTVTFAGPLRLEGLRYRMVDDRSFEMAREGMAWVRWMITKLTADELVFVSPDGQEMPLRREK